MSRNNISDKLLLESILKFIFDSIGSPISAKKISDTLTSKVQVQAITLLKNI